MNTFLVKNSTSEGGTMLDNIPAELKRLPQWVVADMSIGENGLPKKKPFDPKTGRAASPTDPKTWGTFEQAAATGWPVGFVLSETDPYAIIDLDDKLHNPATPEQKEIHQAILTQIDSYTEKSISGRGYHIVVKGKVPKGSNRDNVELYSSGRFMICTGDVTRHQIIADYQPFLDAMYSQMQPVEISPLTQVDGNMTDTEIVEMAMNAANSEKFNDLCRGEWEKHRYPSASEADLALISMFAFYTQDNAQVYRLFNYTALGKRPNMNPTKFRKTLEQVRSKEPAPVDMSKLNLMAKPLAPDSVEVLRMNVDLALPPGIIGDVAKYIYESAPRPVKEYGMMAALAMIAGMTGRAYSISNTGLNQYFVALGETGSGKEGMALGIDNLFAAIRQKVPSIDTFSGPGAFASGQGLDKLVPEKPCFVTILGEFGLLMKRILDVRASSADVAFKSSLLKLYNSSGPNQYYKGTAYSNKDNNAKPIRAPNVTFLGESVATSFFAALSSSDAEDGFIPRLLIGEYHGSRPYLNDNAGFAPPDQLVQDLSDLAITSLTLQANNQSIAIQQDADATQLLRDFNLEIDNKMRLTSEGPIKHILNRSHLKALKLAGLLAVGVNPQVPVVTKELAVWAMEFVRSADSILATRFESGEVGEGDSQFEPTIRRLIKRFQKMDDKGRLHCKWPENQLHVQYFPFNALRDQLKRVDPFKTHRMGYINAIEMALKDMCEANILVEIPSVQLPKVPNGKARAYGLGSQW